MSIAVTSLTKVYASQKALDAISFTADKGQITGFLGPNGAGKSTTMKILTGFIAATSGNAVVDDIDVSVDPLRAKQVTGYLPENNPLYLDMYVREYLRFIGEAYKVPKLRMRVEKMIEDCGLELEKRKKIRALSKGYRQRVGLAQALIHDPNVLILDEPTSGLDPNQLVEIRSLIKQVSIDKTVILSTHIMQEVESLCDNVVIINRGRIVADDDLLSLKNEQAKAFRYKVEFEKEVQSDILISEGLEITKISDAIYEFSSTEDPRKRIMQLSSDNDLPLVSITKVEQSLEQVFQQLTQENAGNS
ncbi:MAG: gliding motility-associated ABC transporter ATP-binding subunit GldA [Bacteroidota bacterium]